MKIDPVKAMEVLAMIQQAKEKTQFNQQTNQEENSMVMVLGGFIEKIMEKELEGKSVETNPESLNRFGRVEPNYKTQEDKEVRLNLQKLLLSEIKVAMTLEENKTEELIEKYLENFTKRELATLLYKSRTK